MVATSINDVVITAEVHPSAKPTAKLTAKPTAKPTAMLPPASQPPRQAILLTPSKIPRPTGGLSTPAHKTSDAKDLPKSAQPKPKPKPKPTAEEMVKQDQDVDAEGDVAYSEVETYADYKPAKLRLGRTHPDPVVETASLATVQPPEITYELQLPKKVIDDGLLSSLQLESVVYASQQHEQLNPDKTTRRGFLVGDGAGVGKGRTIAGIVYENFLCGREKSIWLSVSTDLKLDAERDLRDIGARIPVHFLNKFQYGSPISARYGVMFSTYIGLISRSTRIDGTYGSRLEQLVAWAGEDFDGVIVFDECHKAKNINMPNSSVSRTLSRTAQCVIEIQHMLPKARVVYASATGASETRHLGYMTRLGLWGRGTPHSDFGVFCRSIEKRGVGAMELVAVDLKMRGCYIARQLSFKTTSFEIVRATLDSETRKLYDDCVDLWSLALRHFREAETFFGKGEKRPAWQAFWASHQKFFKYMCIGVKVPFVVEIAKRSLESGKCVVIGLQSTGEAKTLEALESGNLSDFISSACATFKGLIEGHFPTALDNPNQDGACERLHEMKQELEKKINKLGPKLPNNTLDDLIDRLGGPSKVAEMTGRKGRMVRDEQGQVGYRTRNEVDSVDLMNIEEKRRFMDGDKLVAIISEAASSGISLQADKRVKNTRRRVHITIELPWSADRAIQQFGRTHRSNQISGPEYVFIISDLAGENRFASIVAKRLESLGALTHGDRRANCESRDLSSFNIDSKFCHSALEHLNNYLQFGFSFAKIKPDYDGDFLKDARQAYNDAGLSDLNAGGEIFKPDLKTTLKVNIFLNRLLGMKVAIQNAIFDLFTKYTERLIAQKKAIGEYDPGILELNTESSKITADPPEHYTIKTKYDIVRCSLWNLRQDRGMSWEEAQEKLDETDEDDRRSGFYVLIHPIFGTKTVKLAIHEGGDKFRIYKPNMGRLRDMEQFGNLNFKSKKVTGSKAKVVWDEIYQKTKRLCIHMCMHNNCKRIESGFRCDEGVRKIPYCILSGGILTILPHLEAKVPEATHKIRIIRAKLDENTKIIGPSINVRYLDKVKKVLEEAQRDAVLVQLEQLNVAPPKPTKAPVEESHKSSSQA